MKRIWEWVEVGFALVGLGVVIAFLIYAFKLHSEGAAAWIQAIGAIGAIIGAFTVASNQAKNDRRQALDLRRLERKQGRAGIRAVAEHANREAIAIELAFKAMPPFAFQMFVQNTPVISIPDAIRALESIPLHETASADAVAGFIGLKSALQLLHSEVGSYLAAGSTVNKQIFQGRIEGPKNMAEYSYNRLTSALDQLDEAERKG